VKTEKEMIGYKMQKGIIYKTLRMIGYRRAGQLASKSLAYGKHSLRPGEREKRKKEKRDKTIVRTTRNNNIQYLNYPETFLFAGSCTTCFFVY